MALTLRHNITTAVSQDLITAGDEAGDVKSIHLTNINATTTNKADLFLFNCGSTFYIIKNVELPVGATLIVDTSEIKIDTRTGKDSLRIKLSESAGAVDVIINN